MMLGEKLRWGEVECYVAYKIWLEHCPIYE